MFSVTVDLEHGVFETAMTGLWTIDTMEEFGRAVEHAIQRIRATGRAPLSLCNYSGAMVQTQEVMAAFAAMMENPAVRSKRVAVYTDGALTRLQAKRATDEHEEFRFFTDRAEALKWLLTADRATVQD